MSQKILLFLIIGSLILIPLIVYAADEPTDTTIVIKYTGPTKITNMIDSAKNGDADSIVTSESDKIMKLITFPYTIPGTEITVNKFSCDLRNEYCNFWITAYRNGQEVYTNSPVGISPPPYLVIASESYNPTTNVRTVTMREDPLEATAIVLKDYVNSRPLGKGTVGWG